MPCPHNQNPQTCIRCRQAALNIPMGSPGQRLPGGPPSGQRPPHGPPPGGRPLVGGNVGVQMHGSPPRVGIPTTPPARGPVRPPAVTTGRAQIDAFTKDVISRTTKFTKSQSSLENLFKYLEEHVADPIPFEGNDSDEKVKSAIKKCKTPTDKRIDKYRPAIKGLVKVWGSERPYAPEPKVGTVVVVPKHTRGRAGDLEIVQTVCQSLLDVKIADVDFGSTKDPKTKQWIDGNVARAAKRKMIGGKSLYQHVKDDWAKRATDNVEHEQSMTNAKANAKVLGGKVSLADLGKIAAVVKKHRYAVCESITATIISECMANGFAGRLEWIGIKYSGITGHSIVVGHRQGNNLTSRATWGDYFVIDLWYYNLGMRDQHTWETRTDRDQYAHAEFTSPLEVIADLG